MTVKLNNTDYPGIDPRFIGQWPNVCYGELQDIECQCIDGGGTAYPTADITAVALTFDVDSADRFPSTPFEIQVQEERMNVTDVTGDTFTVTRGYGNTEAAAHRATKTVFEVKTSYIYEAHDLAMHSAIGIFIDDQKQDETNDTRITFYTGQSGDELADYEGKAIIKFAADGYVAPQFNVEDAADKESGQRIDGVVARGSNHKVYDGTSETVTIGQQAPTSAWVEFAPGNGTIIRQEYTVTITNTSGGPVSGIASVTVAGVASKIRPFTIGDGDTIDVVLNITGGQWDDRLNVVCGSGNIKISSMAKVTTRRYEKFYDNDVEYATQYASRVIESYNDTPIHWATYSSTALGTEVISQTHSASITVSSAGRFRIVGVNPTTNVALGDPEEYELSAGGHVITVKHDGGSWDTMTKVIIITGAAEVSNISKLMEYSTLLTEGANNYRDTSTARIVVGERISITGIFAVDETGAYGGSGQPIKRPDWVEKHFLIEHWGYAAGAIDATTFDAAGTLYAAAISGGYEFAFKWNGESVKEMAFEARSTIRETAGVWYLNFLPDTAPAALKTITKEELYEDTQFVFDKMSVLKLQNDLTANFKKDYQRGGWLGTALESDSASQTKYDPYFGYYDFKFIRSQAMADDVLDHILLQRKAPLSTLKFVAFYEHFNLNVGDTFAITNAGLFDTSKKYYIENKSRDKNTMQVIAKEWW